LSDKKCFICEEREPRVGKNTCFECHKQIVENAVRERPLRDGFTPAEGQLIEDARKVLTSSALTSKGLAEIEQMVLDAYEALVHLEKGEKKAKDPKGLYGKYVIFKARDVQFQEKKPHYNVLFDAVALEGCFVLRPEKDKAARKALGTYAVSGIDPELCNDLVAWIKKLEKEKPLVD
jgi:hypothetical protein